MPCPNVQGHRRRTAGVTDAAKNEQASGMTAGRRSVDRLVRDFFDDPFVMAMRWHRYTDARVELGDEIIDQCLDAGCVVVPWAEHADMRCQWECCEDHLRQRYESFCQGVSISRRNLAAQARYYCQGRPMPKRPWSDQKSTDGHQAEIRSDQSACDHDTAQNDHRDNEK